MNFLEEGFKYPELVDDGQSDKRPGIADDSSLFHWLSLNSDSSSA